MSKKFITFILVLFLSACGANQATQNILECTQSGESDGYSSTSIFKGYYNEVGSRLLQADLSLEMQATNDQTRFAWNFLVQGIDAAFNQFRNNENVQINSENDPDNYTYKFNIHINVENLTDAMVQNVPALQGFDLSAFKDGTMELARQSLTDSGFTC